MPTPAPIVAYGLTRVPFERLIARPPVAKRWRPPGLTDVRDVTTCVPRAGLLRSPFHALMKLVLAASSAARLANDAWRGPRQSSNENSALNRGVKTRSS